MRGHLDIRFNNLINIRAVIYRETKERERDNYVGTIW